MREIAKINSAKWNFRNSYNYIIEKDLSNLGTYLCRIFDESSDGYHMQSDLTSIFKFFWCRI